MLMPILGDSSAALRIKTPREFKLIINIWYIQVFGGSFMRLSFNEKRCCLSKGICYMVNGKGTEGHILLTLSYTFVHTQSMYLMWDIVSSLV